MCLVAFVVSSGGFRPAALRVLSVYYERFWVDKSPQPDLGPRLQAEEDCSRVARELREMGMVLTISGPTASWDLPFVYEDLSDSELKTFTNELERVVASDGDPFIWSSQLRALAPHGQPQALPMDSESREFLRYATKGKPLSCYYFAHLHSATCVAHGYTSRVLGLSSTGRAFHHAVTEVYIPKLKKWVLIDCDFNVAYRRKDGIWLNAGELQQLWQKSKRFRPFDSQVRRRLPDLLDVEVVSLGEPGARLRDSNMKNVKTGLNLHLFEWVLFDCRNNFFSGCYPVGHPIRVRQQFLGPSNSPPSVAPEASSATYATLYPDIGAVAIHLVIMGDKLSVHLGTMTPNFVRFEMQLDGEWIPISGGLLNLEVIPQTIRFRTINRAGLAGPSRSLVLENGVP